MKIFGNGNEPSFKLIGLVVSVDSVKSPRKCSYGNVLRIVLIFGAEHLKTINIVPKSIQKGAKGNLVALFCLLYDFLDGFVGFFQKK
jgi:hypothetical protein